MSSDSPRPIRVYPEGVVQPRPAAEAEEPVSIEDEQAAALSEIIAGRALNPSQIMLRVAAGEDVGQPQAAGMAVGEVPDKPRSGRISPGPAATAIREGIQASRRTNPNYTTHKSRLDLPDKPKGSDAESLRFWIMGIRTSRSCRTP